MPKFVCVITGNECSASGCDGCKVHCDDIEAIKQKRLADLDELRKRAENGM